MPLTIPDFSLVLMMGASGSGKSTFAARHFLPTEILSSDRCRAMVADDEADQAATGDAFDVLYYIAAKRLAARRLTVIDATNLRTEDRKHAIELTRRYHALPVVFALDVPEGVCIERNRSRPDRAFGGHVVRNQVQLLRRSLRGLQREGFRVVQTLSSAEAIANVEITREPLFTDRRTDIGPFDIIGDVHGCLVELTNLLSRLGYVRNETAWHHPEGRRAIFLGDLVDRGPDSPGVLRLVMDMVAANTALCVQGNHDSKLHRKLAGQQVTVSHGLTETLAQLEALPENNRPAFLAESRAFLDSLRSHYWLDSGKLVVAHAGLKAEMHGRGSGAVRSFALYGETTGETDEFGLPVRYEWARDYRGEAMVVYGHTPVPVPEWVNRTICIDTGCVFGSNLTALRYPERELVSVPAERTYAEPVRPLIAAAATPDAYDLLDIEDILGKRIITTALIPSITVREENAAAGLEVMSRFCIDPRWLIYLPPTMSPSETSNQEGLLEHPGEAFTYYRRTGVSRVVVEEKHMGSRAVVVICRDAQAAATRFRVPATQRGVIYTRTGRSFFSNPSTERALLDRLGGAMTASGFWDRFNTSWACVDAELMPWSAKAQSLIDEQYAPVGTAAIAGLNAAVELLTVARARGVEIGDVQDHFEARRDVAFRYDSAWRRYAWDVQSIDDLKLAPFHLLATEGAVYDDQDHAWHMQRLAEICERDSGVLLATAWLDVALDDEAAITDAISWWGDLTRGGGEGIVMKPGSFVARGSKGLIQPALKVRGAEYLRLIYGPEYTLPGKLERLRERGLGGKRRLALQEFALGLEALHRFTGGEPLRRVHECVFGVLALESEPIDPRL
jgi:protein phosphatase